MWIEHRTQASKSQRQSRSPWLDKKYRHRLFLMIVQVFKCTFIAVFSDASNLKVFNIRHNIRET